MRLGNWSTEDRAGVLPVMAHAIATEMRFQINLLETGGCRRLVCQTNHENILGTTSLGMRIWREMKMTN